MVYVFSTTVTTLEQILQLKPHLDKLLLNSRWNFDLDDCDNIFRIDGPFEIAKTAIKLLQDNGYKCEELPD